MPTKDHSIIIRVSDAYMRALREECERHGIESPAGLFRELGAVWLGRPDLSESVELEEHAERLRAALGARKRRK